MTSTIMKSIRAKLALAAALALVSVPAAMAQLTPQPAFEMPDRFRELLPAWTTGTWGFQGEAGCEYTFCWPDEADYIAGGAPKYEIPLIPGTPIDNHWQEIREGLKVGKMLWDPDARCIPSGMPQLTRTGGFKMIALEDRLILLYGGEQKFRTIWLDGRAHPDLAERDFTFNGDSVGHFDEAGHLVIETRNITGQNKAVGPHLPMSNRFWVREVWTIVEPGKIETEVTMMDEDAWSRPHTETWHYNHNPDGELAAQRVCINGANQRYLDDGTGDFVLTGPGGAPLEKADL